MDKISLWQFLSELRSFKVHPKNNKLVLMLITFSFIYYSYNMYSVVRGVSFFDAKLKSGDLRSLLSISIFPQSYQFPVHLWQTKTVWQNSMSPATYGLENINLFQFLMWWVVFAPLTCNTIQAHMYEKPYMSECTYILSSTPISRLIYRIPGWNTLKSFNSLWKL